AATGARVTAARRLLEGFAQTLGWTSVERARARDELEAARLEPAAWAAFQERLLTWSALALERRPEPIESRRLALLTTVSEAVGETADARAAVARVLEAMGQAVAYENATFFRYD